MWVHVPYPENIANLLDVCSHPICLWPIFYNLAIKYNRENSMLINAATIRIHKYLRKTYAFKNVFFLRFLCDFSFSAKIMKKYKNKSFI